MAIETVFILGAGASHAEGAPLQRDLFSEYHRSLNEPESAWATMDKEIVEFFQAFFGIDFAQPSPTCGCGVPFDSNRPYKPYPTFEEVLGIIEIALDRRESFPGFDVTPQNPRLQRMQGHLVDLIANMLGNIGRTGAAYHRKLANSLHKQGSLLTTGFISLNYDTFVDSALEDLHDIDLDYGVDFVTVEADGWRRELLTARWQKPRPERSVALCKLHGSLNWLYCPRCTALIIVPRRFPFVAPIGVDCSCGSSVVPIIVPPTFFKLMPNFHLQQVWRRAERALLSAQRIVFCGYSMPDADLHVKYLLKRAELNRSSAPPDVYIVTEHKEKTDEQRKSERDRYRRLWRDNRLHFTPLSFEQLCELGLDALSDTP
jgi:hypothetical protein